MKTFIRWTLILLVLFFGTAPVAAQYRGTVPVDSSSIRQSSISYEHMQPNYVEKIRPLIAICYDDGYYCVWESCYWHLHRPPAPAVTYSQGDSASVPGLGVMPATLGIVGVTIGRDSLGGESCKMGGTQIRQLRDAGWEIAAHSWGHGAGTKWLTGNDVDIWNLADRDSFEAEVGMTYRLFADTLAWPDVVTWVYPFGVHTIEYAQTVGRWYRYGIGVGNDHADRRNATQAYMRNYVSGRCIELGALGYGAIPSTLYVPRRTNKDSRADIWDDIYDTIDNWAAGFIFMGHNPCSTSFCGADEPTSDLRQSSAYDYSWYDLIATLDTLRAEDQIEVVTVRELLDRMTARPISSYANWIDGRMKDADGDGVPNGATDWGTGDISPRHHVGRFPMEFRGESMSDTIGVDGGDVWGICEYSGGLGCGYWGHCASAAHPGDIIEVGVFLSLIDTTFWGGTDSTLWDTANASLQPCVFLRAYEHSGVDEDSTTFSLQSVDAHMKTVQPQLLDANHTYVYRGADTEWLHLYRQIRVQQQWDTYRIMLYINGPAGIESDSLSNKVGMSAPYLHIKRQPGVKW